ncbi:hypothetical protein D1007_29921 [Hordeum vulgare]|nr:hypothetical protein D1007_29921 [Hordeum vulgare]
MPQAEFQVRQKRDPCVIERVHLKGCELFWSKQHDLIYQDVIKTKKNIYVPVQWIDIDHIKKDLTYFGEPLDMAEKLGIEEIILFQLDFDPEIVAQFFVTVHFHSDAERTMTWMTNGEKMSATWKEFMNLMNIRDEGLENPAGLRPHAKPSATPKEKLLPYFIEKDVMAVPSIPGIHWVLQGADQPSFTQSCIASEVLKILS